MKTKIILCSLAVLLIGSCCACSPGYVMRAAYEQSKILMARESISGLLSQPADSPEITAEEREKLQLVLEAREFAKKIGLDPGNSFTKYVKLDTDTLAWVVVGSKKDSFALKKWWFPIVGSVPYKGFFDVEDAKEARLTLEKEGYEVWIRGTDAFSTLGWFNDPVMSTTLKNSHSRIVNTIVHESVHSTVWIKGSVPFNESLANFIGIEGAVQFYQVRSAQSSYLEEAKREQEFQFELSTLIDKLYGSLEKLYSDSTLTSEQKIEKRGAIFDEVVAPFRAAHPTMTILKSIHNAEILQLKLYLSRLSLFTALFQKVERDWTRFLDLIRKIADSSADSGEDPFLILEREISKT